MSPGMATTPGRSLTAAARSCLPRASTLNDQPRSASAAATARPSPRDAPVIRATGIARSLWVGYRTHVILVVEVNFKSSAGEADAHQGPAHRGRDRAAERVRRLRGQVLR